MKYDIDMEEFKKRHNKEERIRSNIKLGFKVFIQGTALVLICNLLVDYYNCLGVTISTDLRDRVSVIITLASLLVIGLYGLITSDIKGRDNANRIKCLLIFILIIGMKLLLRPYQSWSLVCIFSIMIISLFLTVINILSFEKGDLTYEELITNVKVDLIILVPCVILLTGYLISVI